MPAPTSYDVLSSVDQNDGIALICKEEYEQKVVAGPEEIHASSEMCMRTLHAAGASSGWYIFHCTASGAIMYEETRGEVSGATAIHMPVLVLTSEGLLALSEGGLQLAASIPLAGAATCQKFSPQLYLTWPCLPQIKQSIDNCWSIFRGHRWLCRC